MQTTTNNKDARAATTARPYILYFGSNGWDFSWFSDIATITNNGNQPTARMEGNRDGWTVFDNGTCIGTFKTDYEAMRAHRAYCKEENI